MSVINQKEYLKKYLSLGDEKEKKKRKKKSKIIKDRLKIIDDDIDVPHNIKENELKEFLTAEDAPQVVGIVDERPLSMRLDDYRKSDKWKLVGSDDDEKETNKNKHIDSDTSLPRKSKTLDELSSRSQSANVKRKSRFTDASPPGKYDFDVSPARTTSKKNYDSDVSPPRKSRKNYDSDVSPPRKTKKNYDSDVSPPRKTKKSYDSDASPPRKTKKSYDSDPSPPRKSKRNESPIRKQRNPSESPPRRRKKSDSDTSPKRTKIELKLPKKMQRTLDGKVAGLQSGKKLKEETAALKRREDELFEKMSAEQSGKNAAPILRDRKTGKKRDLEKEAQEEFEKQQIENAKKEKYDKWGKGLKQVEAHKEKVQEEMYEMTKPLARYADDEDLEKYLREQEREGDPMLQYIRKKKRDKAIASGEPVDLKPHYEGEFMPNRYGIPPGHRWDGVDRSNGYEKEWFRVQNSKKAVEEDIYKWSTEDM